MRQSAGNSAVLSAIALIAILLTVVIGAGSYYVIQRQRAETMMQLARAEEASARAVAEQSRLRSTAALHKAQDTADHQPSPDDKTAIRAAIEAVFRAQQDAWNRGDVEAFMDHYWKSDDLTFSSGGKTTRGWDATLARYRERYPTRNAMGRLTLSDLEITPLGSSAALVLGQWKLDRETEPVGGNYSIILRKFDGRWLIIHDHTSRLTE